MNLWLRLLWVALASFFRPRLGYLDESVLSFRVMPHDLDINLHMNNARYLALMDLGRTDMVLRTPLWRLVLGQRLQPVIASANVRFRRPLKPFQRFCLRSRLLAWDGRWLYIQHLIEADGAVACQAVVRGALLRRGSVVPPAQLAEAVGYAGPAPAVPAWVDQLRDLDAGLDRQQQDNATRKEQQRCAR